MAEVAATNTSLPLLPYPFAFDRWLLIPDTSINPSTGVLWAEGDSYSDPETGLTYYWYPPVWKTGLVPLERPTTSTSR